MKGCTRHNDFGQGAVSDDSERDGAVASFDCTLKTLCIFGRPVVYVADNVTRCEADACSRPVCGQGHDHDRARGYAGGNGRGRIHSADLDGELGKRALVLALTRR